MSTQTADKKDRLSLIRELAQVKKMRGASSFSAWHLEGALTNMNNLVKKGWTLLDAMKFAIQGRLPSIDRGLRHATHGSTAWNTGNDASAQLLIPYKTNSDESYLSYERLEKINEWEKFHRNRWTRRKVEKQLDRYLVAYQSREPSKVGKAVMARLRRCLRGKHRLVTDEVCRITYCEHCGHRKDFE